MFTPTTLLERFVKLLPQPGRQTLRYRGVLANGAPWCRHVLPEPPSELPLVMSRFGPRRIDWAT